MKILLINKYLYRRGGTETFTFELYEALASAGHEARLWGMKDKRNVVFGDEDYLVENADYRLSHSFFAKAKILANFSYSFEAKAKLSKFLKDWKPDAAIVSLIHGNITFSVFEVLKKNNVKTIYVSHDYNLVCPASVLFREGKICESCVSGDTKNCIKHKCIHNSSFLSFFCFRESEIRKKKNLLSLVDHFICPSEFMRKQLMKGGVPRNKLVTIYNPLNDESFKFNEGLGDYFLYFGRLSPEKGIDFLIRAFRQTNTRKKLVIAGDGPEKEKLKQIALSDERVSFVGFKTGDELKSLITNSFFTICPSIWYENCPYSIAESMALGKPTIGSDLGGIPELIDNDVTGFVYNHNSFEELEERIDKADSLTPDDYFAMSKNVFAKAREMFDRTQYIAKVMKLIRD